MDKKEIVNRILRDKINCQIKQDKVRAYAPSNIALCKYWGKRNQVLNLPLTSSLSISLGEKGTTTEISLSDTEEDLVFLNNQPVANTTQFYKRLIHFLDLFPIRANRLRIDTNTNIPTAAGLASSASGFAALVLALNLFFNWDLPKRDLSILARLGSGSASRSLWQGFVEWHKGKDENGMDCYAEPILETWHELCIGLCIISQKEKHIDSRTAMQQTVETCPFFSLWPQKVADDLTAIKRAISKHHFPALGQIAESDALAMHATMLSAWPPISYALPETIVIMHKIWKLRQQGLQLYFTQDAGPNLKLLFLESDLAQVKDEFPNLEILRPFQM